MDRTNAERQRRYIARLKAQAKAGGDGDKLRVSNERIAELEQALAQAKRGASMAESANTMLRRDLAQAERKLAEPKTERPPLPPDEVRDRQIKSLKTRVQNLMSELHAVREWNKKNREEPPHG